MDGFSIAVIVILAGTVAVLGVLLCRQSETIFRLRNTVDELDTRRREISNFLTRFSVGIQGTYGIDGAMNAAAVQLCEQTEAESLAIYEFDRHELHCVAVSGLYPLVHSKNPLVFTKHNHLMEALRQETIGPQDGFLGSLIVSRSAELIPCGSKDDRFNSYPEFSRLGSIMAAPLMLNGALVGVVCAVNNRQDSSKPFSQEQFERLRMLMPQILIARNLKQVYNESSRRDRLDQEIELARRLQQSMLPKSNPRWGEFVIDAYSRSAKEVNGDFYDFIKIDDDRMLVLLGDACGKGIPACMLTAMTRSIARALVDNFTTLNDFLCRLSSRLNKDTAMDRFVTLGCCLLDKRGSLLEFARAGHTNLITFVHQHIRMMSPRGTALGIVPGRFAKFDTVCIAVAPHTSVLMYSDGFSEATDASKEEFGTDRLVETFSNACNATDDSAAILNTIAQRVIDYEQEQSDDQTLVLIRRV